jgi:hypothetical protein
MTGTELDDAAAVVHMRRINVRNEWRAEARDYTDGCNYLNNFVQTG